MENIDNNGHSINIVFYGINLLSQSACREHYAPIHSDPITAYCYAYKEKAHDTSNYFV